MKVVLVTSSKHKFGETNVLPIVGEVTFSNEGEIEVNVYDEQELYALLGAVPDLDLVELVTDDAGKAGAPINLPAQIDTNDLGKADDEIIDITGNPDAEILDTGLAITSPATDNVIEILSLLDGKNVKELKELATESGLPAAEWSTLTKPYLLEYLKGKLNATV